jgi:four helix bundle protein
MGSGSYRELVVWQKAMDLVIACYKLTANFPASERYGLTDQLRRAAVSVPANIAEGQARQYDAEFVRFLYISSGSLAELETHFQIAQRLDYLDRVTTDHLLEQCSEVARLLHGLILFQKKKLGGSS